MRHFFPVRSKQEEICSGVCAPQEGCSSGWKTILFFLLFLCSAGSVLIFSFGCSLPKPASDKELADSISAPEIPATEKYMSEGSLSFQHGAFEDAISNWTEAFLLFEKEMNTNKQCEVLIKLSQAYQSVGQYDKALKSLERALTLAKESNDKDRTASTLGYLGNLHIAIGQADMAEHYLNESLTMAKDLGDSVLGLPFSITWGTFLLLKKNTKMLSMLTKRARCFLRKPKTTLWLG